MSEDEIPTRRVIHQIEDSRQGHKRVWNDKETEEKDEKIMELEDKLAEREAVLSCPTTVNAFLNPTRS